MALRFNPPSDIINNYLNRPTPLQQVSSSVEDALSTYAQQRAIQQSQNQAKLKMYVDAFNAGGPDFATEVARRSGLTNPPTLPGAQPGAQSGNGAIGAPAQTPSMYMGPTGKSPNDNTTDDAKIAMPPPSDLAGLPANQGDALSSPSQLLHTPPPAPAASLADPTVQSSPSAPTAPSPISPVVQASLAAGHPNYAGIPLPGNDDPSKLLGQGQYGTKQLAARESLAKYQGLALDAQTKREENEPKSFDYARGFAKDAGAPDAADPFIEQAQNEGRSTLTKREISDMKDAINASAQRSRGEFFTGSLDLRAQQLRQSLNKDARDALNPYFQTGAGRDQITRLQAIGRVEPIVQQMLQQKNGGTPQQMRELATSFNRVLTGSGLGSEGQIDALVPDTGRGRLANLQQFLSNNPSGTAQQAFINQMAESIQREKGAITGQVRAQAESAAPTLRLLRENYPEDYNAQVNSVLKSPILSGQPNVGKIKVSNGKQTLMIDPSDQAAAAKDGFQVTP